MPSPYGAARGASTYYQHGGVQRHYVLDWTGLPTAGARAATTRDLGQDFLDVTAHFHKELGDYATHPIAMSQHAGRRSVLHSGPEQSHIYDTRPALGCSCKAAGSTKLVGVCLGVLVGFVLGRCFGGTPRP